MIRIVIENIVLFFLPAAIYVAYVVLTRDDPRQTLFDGLPLVWLVAAGSAMVVVVLVAFGSSGGGRPDQHYEPPTMKNGRIEPGHIR